MAKSPDGTQSISRAIQILKLFDDTKPYWDLQQVIDTSGLKKSTVFRILSALEHDGLLEKSADGTYKLGSEMIALGGRAARVNNLRSVSHPLLEDLTQRTGETTTLEVPRHEPDDVYHMLVIDEVLGRHLVGITQYIGTRLPIHATSTGKAILAFQDTQQLDDMLAAQSARYTDQTRTTKDALLEDLSKIRECGCAVAYGELEEGLVAIGAPVFDADGKVAAAVSLVGPSVRINRDQATALAEAVKETAQHISYQIGYR